MPLESLSFPPTKTNRNREVTIQEGHDRAAKRIVGNMCARCAIVLRAFVPGKWVADLDLDTLRPLPAELVGAELCTGGAGTCFGWPISRAGGSVIIPVEAQSTPNTRMDPRAR